MKDEEVAVDPIDAGTLMRESVAIAPGVMLPKRFTARVMSDTLEVVLDVVVPGVGFTAPTVERVTATACLLKSRGYGQGVTGQTLRSIPVATVLRAAVRQVVWVRSQKDEPVFVLASGSGPGVVAPWDATLDRQDLISNVAILYLVADAIGDGPTATVAKVAGVSRATAGRWVDEARKAGLLPPVLSRETAETPDPDVIYLDGKPLGGIQMVSLPKNYAEVEAWYREHNWPRRFLDDGEPD